MNRTAVVFSVFGLLLYVTATGVRADVDLTGKWIVVAVETECLDFVQSGTSLTATPSDTINPPYSGTIDPMTGVFSISQPPTCPTTTYLQIDATAAPDGNSFSGIATAHFYHCTEFGCSCIDLTFGASGNRERCGDGYVNLGSEQCDDGNATNGDCCSSACLFEDGLVCDDGDALTSDDVCAGGVCRGTPTPETDFRVNTYTTSLQVVPAVACNPAGAFVVTWEGFPALPAIDEDAPALMQ